MHALNFGGPDSKPERVIFAVDDDPDDRLMFGRLMAQPGLEYPIKFFATGCEMMDALLKVLRGAPAPLACFIDVRMAGMSGFDVLRWIRCQDALDSVPVIMLSALGDPQKLNEAREVGAQAYVAKFPTASELRNILTEARRYCADRSNPAAFHLPCNLLLSSPAPGETAHSSAA